MMFLFSNKNGENNCYLNSVLQSLLNIKPLIYFLQNYEVSKDNIIRVFQNIIARDNNKVINSRNIKKILAKFDKTSETIFGNNDQQDAHEAIVKILDIIHVSSNYSKIEFREYEPVDSEIKKQSLVSWKKDVNLFGYSFITEYFTGQFRTTIACTSCNYKSTTFNIFNTMNLSIIGHDISECITNFIKSEHLDSVCEKCHSDTRIKTTTIWKFPAILIINLQRFIYDKKGNYGKLKKQVELNKTLHFSSSGNIYNYELQSVIYHHGSSPNSGHYTTDILKDNIWYKIDDDDYKNTKLTKSSTAYVLVYSYYN
jgi:ubiquitin carboxyl-terminal hydrolase 8